MLLKIKKMIAKPYLRLSLAHVRRNVEPASVRSFAKTYIVAELSRNTGITQGARLQYAFFESNGVNVELLDATEAARNPLFRVSHEPGTAYIFHSGGPQTVNLIRSVLPQASRAYRIAYWAWELPAGPRKWPAAEGLVSEIWTCSDFAAQSLRSVYQVPVLTVPHVPRLPERSEPKRPGRVFEVLTFADSRSSLDRKNPKAAIAAFQKAFGQDPAARLTIKLNGRPDELAPLFQMVAGSPNVRIVSEFLREPELHRLYQSSSVLLSLHRAEGFGLPMLEAMAHGLPVIATNWSGNLEFMSGENSLLVPFSMKQIGEDSVYHNYRETHWADPDVSAAASYLRLLFADPNKYMRLSASAIQSVRSYVYRQKLPFSLTSRGVLSRAHAAGQS